MERYIIWGTGSVARIFYYWLSGMEALKNSEIICFVDNDHKKRGSFAGKPVIAPANLEEYDYDYISIWSIKYEREIRKQITEQLKIPHEKIKDIFWPYKQLLYSKYNESADLDIKDILKKMESQHGIDTFYFERKNSNKILNEAYYDAGVDLFYFFFEGKRMYLKRSYNYFREENGKKYVGDLWGEQDPNSPHLYESNYVFVQQNDVLVDAGACEGNFTLHNIDKIRKAYLIECDKEWLEALQYTFKPYKDKIQYCSKYLSNVDSEKTICLDSLITEKVDFIKMDIEGEEINALEGARELLATNNTLKCAICSYHRHNDEQNIKQILHKYGFGTEVSKGYMLFLSDHYVQVNPELRRGIVRGRK